MIELISMCSPQMQLPIAQAIIQTESRFNQFAIGVNKGGKAVKQPTNYQEAVVTAKRLIAQGANIDLGLAQINSANLGWLGLSVEQVLQPCNNLKAMQTVYLSCYDRAGNTGLGTRMQRAFSCYNTGNFKKGFSNGYVNKATTHFNHFVANANYQPNQFQYQQYPTYVQTQKNKVEYIKLPHHTQNLDGSYTNIAKVQNIAQNANQSGDLSGVKPHSTDLEQGVKQAEATPAPVKVFHSWDIFREF